MRWMKIAALTTFLMGPALPVAAAPAAAPATVDQLTEALGARYKGVKSLQAAVTQTSKTALGDTTMTGTVQVQRPGKARWELSGSGYETLMVFDGETGWIYTPAANQVIKMDQSGGNALDPIDLVTTMKDRFDVELAADAPADRFVVKGKPKAGTQLAAQYAAVRLEVSRDGYLPLRLVLTDTTGGSTDIEFADPAFDQAIDPAQFEFAPPAGVEVVDASL